MSDEPEPRHADAETGTALTKPESRERESDSASRGPQAQLLDRLLRLENDRIESNNRRTEVAMQAVKASDEADRRQFEYQMERLRSETSGEARRDGHARNLLYGAGLFALAVISLFLYMAFFGRSDQQQHAFEIIKVILTGGAGWGIISGVLGLGRRLMRGFGAPPQG